MGEAALNLTPTLDWMKPALFAQLTGYTEKAMEHRRLNGKWPQGLVWDRIEGEILFSYKGYTQWVEQHRETPPGYGLGVTESRSPSPGAANESHQPGRESRRQRTSGKPSPFVLR